MKTTKYTFIITAFILVAGLFFSCKKDKVENIDYNSLTEQRILEVSEQASVSNDDISSLERLLEKVPDNATRTRLSVLLEGVKLIKDLIPGINQLRTDPEVDFQTKYAELETTLKQVSDQLPRKAKLEDDLKNAKADYNTEEYEYPEWVVSGDGRLGTFLAENFNIHPVASNPNRFLRSDIERVDSLRITPGTNEHPSVPLSILKTFKGLRYLQTNNTEDVLDLNSLVHLETLMIAYTGELKIDQLQNIKTLELNGKWGETMDFTDKYPLLERLAISDAISKNLKVLLLPNKQYLTSVEFRFSSDPGFFPQLPNINRLVLEGNGIKYFSVPLGSDTHREIEEVTLSGFGGAEPAWELNGNNISFSLGGGATYPNFVKIKKLSLSNINAPQIGFGGVDLPAQIDLAQFPLLRSFSIGTQLKVNSKPGSIDDILGLDKFRSSLMQLQLDNLNYPDGTLDLSDFSKLVNVGINSSSDIEVVQPLRKLIISRALSELHDPGDGSCDGCGVGVPQGVEKIIK